MNQRLELVSRTSLEQLAQRCLSHLQLETAMLQQAHAHLGQLHSALLSRSVPSLAAAAQQQVEIGKAMQEIAAHRRVVRQAIAAALDLPVHQATLGRLAESVAPPARHQLRTARQQTAQLAQEVDRLTRNTAAIIQSQLTLLDEVLACLTGRAASAPRYTAGGAMERPHGGSMFETRC